ncbi:hypothetical protein SAMN05443635_1238 [Roseobacter denitrificans OCh 114]|uniref:Uncharacterized protein n=1 Tax=Roseobacter denitrificans (strain ATCC 33942 / OCh 114) TaxID=375451 RepID=Q07GC6_ROSDO|nr:hypothetical protein [Roseobacter denitrificans]ABI93473.1 hypothetical protein RD1_C0008 [Roseobacter denitrificans OCh 114]SFG48835.1 hypothetical protein SAMN05443635_1238 [Roseobacter denitrificans OCh 114]
MRTAFFGLSLFLFWSQQSIAQENALDIEVLATSQQNYEVDLPIRSGEEIRDLTIYGHTFAECVGSDQATSLGLQLPSQLQPIRYGVLASLGLNLTPEKVSKTVLRRLDSERTFYVAYDLLADDRARHSFHVFERSEPPFTDQDTISTSVLLRFACGYDRRNEDFYLALWKNSFERDGGYDDKISIRYAFSNWSVFGGIQLPNSPSMVDVHGNIILQHLSADIDDYIDGLEKISEYWRYVGRRQLYSWDDFLFLEQVASGPFFEAVDANVVFERPGSPEAETAVQSEFARLDAIAATIVENARTTVSVLESLQSDTRPATEFLDDLPRRKAEAASETASETWQSLHSNLSGLGPDEESALYDRLADYQRTINNRDNRERVSVEEQFERWSGSQKRSFEELRILYDVRVLEREMGQRVQALREEAQQTNFDNRWRLLQRKVDIVGSCFAVLSASGEVSQENITVLRALLNSFEENVRGGVFLLGSTFEVENYRDCALSLELGYEHRLADIQRETLLPFDRAMFLRLNELILARERYLTGLADFDEIPGGLSSHLQTLRRERGLAFALRSMLTPLVYELYWGRTVEASQTFNRTNILLPSATHDLRANEIDVFFPETSSVSTGPNRETLIVQPTFSRRVSAVADERQALAFREVWRERSGSPVRVQIRDLPMPLARCPIFLTDVELGAVQGTVVVALEWDHLCRTAEEAGLPFVDFVSLPYDELSEIDLSEVAHEVGDWIDSQDGQVVHVQID